MQTAFFEIFTLVGAILLLASCPALIKTSYQYYRFTPKKGK